MKRRHPIKMISLYVDDELSPDEKKDFESHVRGCASCREALEETFALRRIFASAERFPAPYGFASRVLANAEENGGSRFGRLLRSSPFLLRGVQTAFALAVMTFGAISGNHLLPESPDRIGQTAVQESFSLDLFQAAPPDSIGGIYNVLMRPSHEK